MNEQTVSAPGAVEEQSHAADVHVEQDPPQSPLGILRQLGPGLIVAGSIVGSGELIATTKTGAEAGFWLLWLILIGCVIKVFVQVEFGRYAISAGRTTLAAMDEVPGPRIRGRGNWLVWYWFLMFLASLGQLGGIVGGVGQAMAISMPLTESGRAFNHHLDMQTRLQVREAELARLRQVNADRPELVGAASQLTFLEGRVAQLQQEVSRLGPAAPKAYDAQLWAAIIAVITAVILMLGRYGFIQWFSTALVATFTVVSIVNLIMLQKNPVWSVSMTELLQGMQFRLPPTENWNLALGTALATFGIIGVGASELVTYPYWCLEKGYARYTGPRTDKPAWAERAQGWLRVLRWDAWFSMVVYTFATLAFYLLGASILGRSGLNPKEADMVRTLSEMYVPVFGKIAQPVFLFGAFAVLYSTYFVANASHARTFSDALRVLHLGAKSEQSHRRLITILSGLFPMLCLAFFVLYPNPVTLVLLSGVMQAMMLPMLAGAALYFRYRRIDPRLTPSRLWDAFLWVSAAGLLIAGGWTAFIQFGKLRGLIEGWLAGGG
jgi:Mn2+/Fe2+ NRAMP family transporter